MLGYMYKAHLGNAVTYRYGVYVQSTCGDHRLPLSSGDYRLCMPRQSAFAFTLHPSRGPDGLKASLAAGALSRALFYTTRLLSTALDQQGFCLAAQL